MYMATIAVIGAVRPGFLPTAPRASWAERLRGAREIWAPLALFVFAIGGLYGGLFTPTGASGALLLSVARRRMSRADTLAVLLQATRTAAAVFTVLIGAILFGYFLAMTQTPQRVTEFITGLGLARDRVPAVLMLMHLALGRLMDAMATTILAVPIIFSGGHRTGVRPGMVRRDHCHDSGIGADPSAGRGPRVRHQYGREGRQLCNDLAGRAAVRADRYHPIGGADRIPGNRDVADRADVAGLAARALARRCLCSVMADHGGNDQSFATWYYTSSAFPT
jgi:hypothetical protein